MYQSNLNYEGGFSLIFATVCGLLACCSYMFSSLEMAIYCLETAFKENLLLGIPGLLCKCCIFLPLRLLNPCKHYFRYGNEMLIDLHPFNIFPLQICIKYFYHNISLDMLSWKMWKVSKHCRRQNIEKVTEFVIL